MFLSMHLFKGPGWWKRYHQTEISKVTLGSSPSILVSRRGKLHGSICGRFLRANCRVIYHCAWISLAEIITEEEAGKCSLFLCPEEDEIDLDKWLAIIYRHICTYDIRFSISITYSFIMYIIYNRHVIRFCVHSNVIDKNSIHMHTRSHK